MTTFEQHIILSFGYDDLVGIANSGGIERIKKEIKKYNLYAILTTAAKISMTLSSGGLPNPVAQATILSGVFPDYQQRINYYEIARAKANGMPWTIFNNQGILTLVKLAILNCPEDKGLDMTPVEIERLGYWLLIINDEMFVDESGVNILLPDLKADRERLRAALARYQFFQDSERFAYKIARYKWIVDYLRKTKIHKIDVDALFKEATGLILDDYLVVCTALVTKWINIHNKKPDITKDWVTCKQYLRKLILPWSKVDEILEYLFMEPKDYASKHLESIQILEGKDYLYYNFLPFIWKPLIRQNGTDCFVCPSYEYMYDKVTQGVYREIETYLRRSKQKKVRQSFSIAWGDAFEKHIYNSLENIFGSSFIANPKDEDGREVIDGMVDSDSFVFLIETKNHHWKYNAMLSGSKELMKSSLNHLFAEKGLKQITTCIQKIKNNKFKPKIKVKYKWIIPIIVVSENIPQDPYNRKLYEEVAAEANSISNDRQVLPFIILTAEEVEMLEALHQKLGPIKIGEILSEYSLIYIKKDSHGIVKEAISFKNHLYHRGYEKYEKSTNNFRLMRIFNDFYEDISMKAFGTHLKPMRIKKY
ncbi:MAG TPA: hypothetical protein VK338_03440 [Candidatus Nitrosocosmicus sp.]|nr:hypothetical protein [Candidatus Nitrosocosmicus sp.]